MDWGRERSPPLLIKSSTSHKRLGGGLLWLCGAHSYFASGRWTLGRAVMRMWEVEAVDHWRCSFWETLWPCQPPTPSRPFLKGLQVDACRGQRLSSAGTQTGGRVESPVAPASMPGRGWFIQHKRQPSSQTGACMHAK